MKIVDFGIAKLTGVTDLTETGTALGTAAYMSPEQASGARVDWRTDMWSLGVVLYQMLRGEMPFHGETFLALLYQVVHADCPPLTGKPPALQRLVVKCLAKDPRDRYASPEELVAELERVRKSIAAGDAADTVAFHPEPPPAVTAPAFISLGSATPRFSPRLLGLLAAVCLGGAAWLWMEFRTPSSPETPDISDTSTVPGTKLPAASPAAGNPAPESAAKPAASSNGTSQPRAAKQTATASRGPVSSAYTGPKRGQILFDLDAGQEIDLGSTQTAVPVTGSLPGVQVSLDVHPPGVRVVTPPGPSSQWRRMVLRNDGTKRVFVLINWAIIAP